MRELAEKRVLESLSAALLHVLYLNTIIGRDSSKAMPARLRIQSTRKSAPFRLRSRSFPRRPMFFLQTIPPCRLWC